MMYYYDNDGDDDGLCGSSFLMKQFDSDNDAIVWAKENAKKFKANNHILYTWEDEPEGEPKTILEWQ